MSDDIARSDLFRVGQVVRLQMDPGQVGVVLPERRTRGNILLVNVQFGTGRRYVPEDQLEPVPSETGDPLEQLRLGTFARPADLRRTLTHARLSGRLTDIIYSMDATNTTFYAYQFKPLVRLLNSATTGILIADEVGLGKTIEAGLIWTELRSRFEYRRIAVICPAMLREKWKRELKLRFGVEAQLVDAGEFLSELDGLRLDPDRPISMIASLQGLRPPRGWDGDDEARQSPSARLARLLDESSEGSPLLHLTIIDEAHYMRNPETSTAQLGTLLRRVSEFMVLLSATPIHLRNEDLFNLMRVVDPDTFERASFFEEMLRANEPLIAMRDLVLSSRASQVDILERLELARQHFLFWDSAQLSNLIDDVATNGFDDSAESRSRLAWNLEQVNLLGHALTRTRKRDVIEYRVIREAVDQRVDLTETERHFYDQVTHFVRSYAASVGGPEGFLLVMPQRQMSSSMPAALRTWKMRLADASDQLYEDFGLEGPDGPDLGILGPLMMSLQAHVGELVDYESLKRNDSKYAKLLAYLRRFFSETPQGKCVLFSFFKATLAYLHERLSEDVIPTLVLHGDVSDKDSVIERFQASEGPCVLLSSEVASEGIDLQFCWLILNYDLPWNPMKVEQRIGRLDRIGQMSRKIVIVNFFYENTIDSRIYDRLFKRLRMFERSLGRIEPVLGDGINRLGIELLTHQLTPHQEQEMIDQTTTAVVNSRAEEERLEEEAAHLVAHGDYIVHQIATSREHARVIRAEDIRDYVLDFLRTHYAGCEIEPTGVDGEFLISLSRDAALDLEEFAVSRKLSHLTRLPRSTNAGVLCRFQNTVNTGSGSRRELISQFHPIVQFIRQRVSEDSRLLPLAVATHVARHGEDYQLEPGIYVYLVQQWIMRGLNDSEYLAYAAARLGEPASLLEADEAERLVLLASIYGRDWLTAKVDMDERLDELFSVANDLCGGRLLEAFRKRERDLRARNEDRIRLQLMSIDRHYQTQMTKLQDIRATHERLGRSSLVAATDGRLRKLEQNLELRRRKIEEGRLFASRHTDLGVGVIRVV